MSEPFKVSSTPVIRAAGPDDLDVIDALEAGAFEADRFARRNLRRLLVSPSAHVLIASLDGGPAGYALVLFRQNASTARLYSIAVDGRVRGRGVGAALIAACEAEAARRGAVRLRLEVRASNETAIRAYARAGYEHAGQRAQYYPDGEDAVIMDKAIAPSRTGKRS